MTIKEALEQLRLGPGINEDVSEEYNDATDIAIKYMELIENDDTSKCFAVLKTPESCADCPLCVLPASSNNTSDWKCALLDEIIFCDIFDKRWKQCPLKEVEE